MPSYLSNLGVGFGDVQGYADASTRSQFARNFGGQFSAGSAAAGALSGIRGAGGDWKAYLGQRMRAKGHGSLEQELGPLASVLSTGTDFTPEQAMGNLMAQLSGSEQFAPLLKGRGAHAAGMTARDKTSLQAQGEMQISDAKMIANNINTLISEIRKAPERYVAFDAAGKAGGAAAGDLKGFSVAMDAYTKKLGEYTSQLTAAIGATKTKPR